MEEKADDNKEVEKKKLMSLTGPTTLTSLMTQDKKSKDGKDYIYVHIGELKKNEIFVSYLIKLFLLEHDVMKIIQSATTNCVFSFLCWVLFSIICLFFFLSSFL